MSTAGLDTRSAVLLRGTCTAVAAFLHEQEQHHPNERVKARAKALREQLERVLAESGDSVPFDEVAAITLAAPGVEWGFLQKECSLAKWRVGHVPADRFRVYLHNGTKGAECARADLLTAVREAFAAIGAKVPKPLAAS